MERVRGHFSVCTTLSKKGKTLSHKKGEKEKKEKRKEVGEVRTFETKKANQKQKW